MNPPGPGFASRLYFALHYGYQQGNLRYQGFALASHQPLSITDHSQVQTVSIPIGKGIPVSQRVLLTPYFLYRFVDWQRHLQNTLGQSEHHYESNSAGIGLLAQCTPAHGQSYPGIFDEPASQTNRLGLDLGIAYQFA